MPIDEGTTSKYVRAVDLVAMLLEDPGEIETYCENNDPEQIYADLIIQGYQWTGEGWYTEEFLQSQAAERKKKAQTVRKPKLSDAERLRQWNAGEPIRAPRNKKSAPS